MMNVTFLYWSEYAPVTSVTVPVTLYCPSNLALSSKSLAASKTSAIVASFTVGSGSGFGSFSRFCSDCSLQLPPDCFAV